MGTIFTLLCLNVVLLQSLSTIFTLSPCYAPEYNYLLEGGFCIISGDQIFVAALCGAFLDHLAR